MSDFSSRNFLKLPNASKPLSPPANSGVIDLSSQQQIQQNQQSSQHGNNRDEFEWHTLKVHLKKVGFNDAFLQAIDNDCPSFDVLQAFIAWTEQQKRQEAALNQAVSDAKAKNDTLREEMKEAATLRDIEYDAMTKRLKAAQVDVEASKSRVDKLEAALKQEREDRNRLSNELASRDFEIMELKNRVQQLQSGDVQALTEINKSLATNQVAMKKELISRDKQIDELKLDVEALKAEREKIAIDVKMAQDQTAQWKANCEEVRHSWRIQLESMKREHEKALREAMKMSSTSSKTSENSPVDEAMVEKVRKLEEISRLQRQVSAKFQEQNEALREELNVKKTELASLSDEKLKLQRQLEEALQLAMASRKISVASAASNLKIEALDSTNYYGGMIAETSASSDFINKEAEDQAFAANNFYLMSIKAAMLKSEPVSMTSPPAISNNNLLVQQPQQLPLPTVVTTVDVIPGINKDTFTSSSTPDLADEGFSVMTNEEIAMMADINDLQSLKTINHQLCKKVSERTAKYFEMRKELQECQTCYTSICKQLQEAKKELDEKDEYIITLRRRLRHCGQAAALEAMPSSSSTSTVQVSTGGRSSADSTGLVSGMSPVELTDSAATALMNTSNIITNNNNISNSNTGDGGPPVKIFRRNNNFQQQPNNFQRHNFQQRRRNFGNNNNNNNINRNNSFTARH